MIRKLVLAAHPDDEVLGCGGLLHASVAAGDLVRVVILGEGSSCRFCSPDALGVAVEIEDRRRAASLAMARLGVTDIRFGDLPCGRFDTIPILEINKLIEEELDSFRPDEVYTHSELDANNDHRLVARSTIMSSRPIGSRLVPRVFAYEVLSSSEWSFTSTFAPNHYVKLSIGDLEAKIDALECYSTEIKAFPFPRSREGIRVLAQWRGMQCGTSHAESFSLIRSIPS